MPVQVARKTRLGADIARVDIGRAAASWSGRDPEGISAKNTGHLVTGSAANWSGGWVVISGKKGQAAIGSTGRPNPGPPERVKPWSEL